MYEQVHQQPDIYKIPVFLPNNPLKILNSYLIRTPEKDLLIDTGFNQPECYASLKEGLEELHVDMDHAMLFLTHLHSDHCGLVTKIATEGTEIIMGDTDYNYLANGTNWPWMEEKFRREGLSPELIELQKKVNPARAYAPDYLFKARTVTDGDIITVGDIQLNVIKTPGHTPGHTCLYIEENSILFSGDHILFDITPNITMWQHVDDSLGNYLKSLDMISKLNIQLTLPGHRGNDMDVYERIAQIQKHHDYRINQTYEIIRSNPGLNACEIGAKMTWSMRGKNWDEFPIQQKWFAIGETISHLDYLVLRGKIIRHDEKDIIYYTSVE